RVLDERFRTLGLAPRIVMESANVELSALYVEMGLGISFATLARTMPRPGRRLAFIPLPGYFQPDHLALVQRRDRVLSGYKKAFINLLFGDTSVGSFQPSASSDQPKTIGPYCP
ncbi:MAG: LysR family transcriptional regulator substrate-binding protein, partial [Desulfobaccales bacterium]